MLCSVAYAVSYFFFASKLGFFLETLAWKLCDVSMHSLPEILLGHWGRGQSLISNIEWFITLDVIPWYISAL